MAQSKTPEDILAAARLKTPAGIKLDRHGAGYRIRAYAGVSPDTAKADWSMVSRLPLGAGRDELVEAATALAARANEIKAARRHRRREGGDAPLPAPAAKPVDRTVGQALEAWWRSHASKLASAGKHRQNLDCYLLPRLGGTALWRLRDTVDPDELEADPDLVDVGAFYDQLALGGSVGSGPGRAGKGRPLSVDTVASIHGTLRAGLNYATKKGWLTANPVAGMTVAAAASAAGEDEIPLEEEMEKLLPFLVADRLEVAVAALLVGNGPRPTEVAAIRWQLLDLDAGRLTLRGEGVVRTSGRGEPERWVVLDNPTAKRRARSVQLDPTLVALLRRLWAQRSERALCCGATLSRRAYVFTDEPAGGAPVTPHSLGTAFARALRRAGLAGLALPPGMTLYSFRHYGITQALRRRVSIAEVARRFGTSKRMINEKYDHAIPGEDDQAAEAMGRVFGAAVAAPLGEVVELRTVSGTER